LDSIKRLSKLSLKKFSPTTSTKRRKLLIRRERNKTASIGRPTVNRSVNIFGCRSGRLRYEGGGVDKNEFF